MRFEPVPVFDVDLQSRAAGRVLRQFSKSEVFLSLLWALVSEIQELSYAAMGVHRYRMPASARGENLNAIGRIVGQDRILIDYSAVAWFRPDTENQSVDQSPVWTDGAPLYEIASADDELYRMLIQAKVFRNFCKFGSIPEIQEAALEAFGVRVSFQRYLGANFECTLLIESSCPLHVLGFLTEVIDDERADRVYLPPYPAQLRIGKEMFLFPSTFGPDRAEGAPDIASATIGFVF
jgi:hypothetical protein